MLGDFKLMLASAEGDTAFTIRVLYIYSMSKRCTADSKIFLVAYFLSI